jgi:hypothetical protein
MSEDVTTRIASSGGVVMAMERGCELRGDEIALL